MPSKPIPPDLAKEDVYEFVNGEFPCDHATSRLTVKVASNNTRHYRRQCLRCGHLIETVKATSVGPAVRDGLPAFDEQLAREWYSRIDARRQEVYEELRARDRADWFGRYDEYLATDGWREKRAKVLERDGWLCQGCLMARATVVHHLTYDHVGNELLHELISLCGPCHGKAHETAKAI